MFYKIYSILVIEITFANLHKLIEAFALSLALKSGNFQKPRDNKQGLMLRRGLPYSWLAFQSLKAVSGDLRLLFWKLVCNNSRLGRKI